MILYMKRNLTLGDNSEEHLQEESEGLPFLCHYNESRYFTGRHIPWHWHDWVELNFLETGSYIIRTPDETLEAGQGDVVFINSNVLHSYDFPHDVSTAKRKRTFHDPNEGTGESRDTSPDSSWCSSISGPE